MLGFLIGTIPTGWLFLPIAAAHLNEQTSFITSSEDKSFSEVQAETTVDFSPHSTVVTFIYGGLNCHLAHHLFPNVASCHYAELYKALKLAAPHLAEQQRAVSFFELFCSHFRLLKQLGIGNPN